MIKKEKIFDKSHILNQKIIRYGNKFGIDLISSGSINMKILLSNKSNDYSVFSDYYEKIVLLNRRNIYSISIIISSYNSEDTILQVLASIEGQKLSKKEKSFIEVIIVDDGSLITISSVLEKHNFNFSFKIKVIRLEKQSGLSFARNIGASASTKENLLFLDSDILLSDNYLKEHMDRLRFFPDTIFVSMKKNIEPNSIINNFSSILKGLETPDEYNDKRLSRIFKKGQKWINRVSLDGVYEILSDTNSFKNFGYGRIINGYDLPSMVVGHNMSLNKDLFLRTCGFSDEFIGWGLEDTYFGVKAICIGSFVVPLLNCGVYHINHPPRSGSQNNKKREYLQNIKNYDNLLNKNI